MRRSLAASLLLVLLAGTLGAAPDPARYAGMRWRMLGPFRGGRTVAVSGVPGKPARFYSGAVDGGVWRTDNAGVTWVPLFDNVGIASIGALAVAPAQPDRLYVGTGETDIRSDLASGDGMYRSDDGGATWRNIGLRETRQIGRVLVDPQNPDVVLVAALGHAYAPNEERGVYRTTDGGATWTHVLARGPEVGAVDLAADPTMTTVFASLWQTRRPPWTVYPPSNGPGSGLAVSHDRGVTWTPVTNGLPSEGIGKIGIAVAPSDPQRVYALVDAKAGGLYRSDDGGATFALIDKDQRLWGRGWYFNHVTVDPADKNHVLIPNTALYESRDGGRSFAAIKGSPDGDDMHQIWIDPAAPERMAMASDQGTTVSLDGGRTWSSWFNQPTAQFYHIAADNAFPYRLYGAQQDSGAAMVPSRSDHRGIQERDWRPITAGGESGMVAPDPLDPQRIFGGTGGGTTSVLVEDLRTGQAHDVTPTNGVPGTWRATWTVPLQFSPIDPHVLYTTNQIVWRTADGGAHWARISPDLPRDKRGVVYALGPSPIRRGTIWAGTDDGTIHLTRDEGRTWRDVTPKGLSAWSKIGIIEASHRSADTAYVAVDRHRLDDIRPHFLRTRDGGRTWTESNAGIPEGAFLNAVREDPVRPGLLYAGTERGVYVSFDDGDHWQSLQLNLPVTSVRDLVVHDGDLAIATHGRGFWILDDVAPLRELAADRGTAGAWLFAPRDAYRLRPGNDEAEALPPEIPVGENPPAGTPIDYVVPAGNTAPVTLDILDAHGGVMRHYASTEVPPRPDPSRLPFPPSWAEPPPPLSAAPGMHRFFWDFHADGIASRRRRNAGAGPLAPPGIYAARMTIAGRTFTQRLVLRGDPRVHVTTADLVAQYTFAREIEALRARIAGLPAAQQSAWAETASLLATLEDAVESADAAPTPAQREAFAALRAAAEPRLPK